MKKKETNARRRAGPAKPRHYSLRLYVTGATPRSTDAISNLRRLCDEYLPGHYDLQVIDIYQQPKLARKAQIIAAPTLIKDFPPPSRRFIGDMSDTKTLLAGLKIPPKPAAAAETIQSV